MKLKRAKKILTVLMALILTMLLIIPVVANEIPPPPNDPWLDEMMRLQNEIFRLERELEEANRQPQPGPIHAPNPRLLSPQQVTVQPGETVDVDIIIRNIGTNTASNVLSQAVPATGSPFTVEFVNNSNIINSISENSQRTMTLRISVNANAAAGNHSITLTHLFRDGDRDNLSTTDTLHVRIEGEEAGLSNLEIRNMSAPIGTIGVGQTATITFNVHNSGQAEARNIRVEAAPEGTGVIVPVQTANTQTITSLAPGESHQLTFSFSPRDAAQTRSYAIGFTVHYGELSFQQFAAINVYNPDEEEDDTIANLEIRSMTAPTGIFNVGQTATISFYVHNRGEAEARNIRVVAAPESATDIVPVQTSNTQVIPSIAPGESHRLTFSFSPRESAVTRSYAIGFTVHYDELSFQQFAAISVFNPEPEEDEDDTPGRVQIPRVIVASTNIYPPIPFAGHEFEMEVTFRNTSATRSVNNIRILMEEVIGTAPPGQSAPFAGFSPVAGSNTLFVDFLDPHGEITMNLRFTTITDASPGAHNMRFSFDYQDQDFYTHEASQQISIPISQLARLELDNVNVGSGWMTPTVGAHVPFGFRIINSSRVNLINVRVRVEGPFDVSQAGGEAGRFVGNVNNQRTVTFEGDIIPLEGGIQEGRFVVWGEDLTGQTVELVYDFSVFVEGGFDMGGDWLEGGGRGDGMMHFPGDEMGMGMMPPGEIHIDHETGATLAGSWDWETGEFTATHEMDPETGEWIEISRGFDFLGLIRRPIVWGPAIGVAVVAIIAVVIIVVRNKKPRFDLGDDDDM